MMMMMMMMMMFYCRLINVQTYNYGPYKKKEVKKEKKKRSISNQSQIQGHHVPLGINT